MSQTTLRTFSHFSPCHDSVFPIPSCASACCVLRPSRVQAFFFTFVGVFYCKQLRHKVPVCEQRFSARCAGTAGMANLLNLLIGPACSCDVEFASGPHNRPPVTVKGESGKPEQLPLFTAHDTVRGQIHLTPAAGKKVEHQGIRVELVGTIELFFDRGNTYDFVSMGAWLNRFF